MRIALLCLGIGSFASFPAFGQTSDCREQLTRMTEAVNKATKEIESLRKENEAQKRTIKILTGSGTQKDQFIDSLSGDLAQKKVEVVSLNSSLSTRKAELVAKDSALAAYKAELNACKIIAEAQRKELQEKNESIRVLQSEAEAHKKEIALKDDYIVSLKNELEAKRKESAAKDEVLVSLGKDTINSFKRRLEEVERQNEELRQALQTLKQNAAPQAGQPQESKKKQ